MRKGGLGKKRTRNCGKKAKLETGPGFTRGKKGKTKIRVDENFRPGGGRKKVKKPFGGAGGSFFRPNIAYFWKERVVGSHTRQKRAIRVQEGAKRKWKRPKRGMGTKRGGVIVANEEGESPRKRLRLGKIDRKTIGGLFPYSEGETVEDGGLFRARGKTTPTHQGEENMRESCDQ